VLRKLFRNTRNSGIAVPSSGKPVAAASKDPGAAAQHACDLAAAGRHAEALGVVDAALQHAAQDPMLMFARGSTLFQLGRHREAREWLTNAATRGLQDAALFLQMGWSSMWTVGPESGEPWMRKAIELDPDNWVGHFGLGMSLQGQKKIGDAVVSFERALTLAPDSAACLTQLFGCRYMQDRFVEAEAYARRAVELDDGASKNWNNLGVALIAQDRFPEATEAFERSEALDSGPGEGDPQLNLGICLRETGRLAEALAYYERKLPTLASVGAHAHYGHALLTAGKLREGWPQYEFRWLQDPLLSLRARFGKPLWSGQDLRDRTILLRSEQGIGDVIQFIRYAPHVKALGATVILQLRKNIAELAKSFPGVDRIVEPGEPLPQFDLYIPLMTLPMVFGTDIDTIPARVPYLRPQPDRVARWRGRMPREDAFKVGLVWAGDPGHLRDRYRSIPLALLAPLAQVEGVQFYSLQKGQQAQEIGSTPSFAPIVDLGPDLHDFADTAAVIDELDLVICVDTSVAHLAGALGRPVWMLVPTPADWRWLEGREDSPWYPTMRLFRQVRQGSWEDVIGRVKASLAAVSRQPSAEAAVDTPPSDTGASMLIPAAHVMRGLRQGPCGVAETRAGIVQYFPGEAPAGTSIEMYGEYLQGELDLLARWIAPGATIVEIAAGIGFHALALAREVGATGHLLLDEADPLRRQVLEQNLRANGITNFTLLAGTADRNGPEAPTAPAYESIDDLHLESLDWIKVNGGTDAMRVFDGAAATLWRLRPKLFVAARDGEMLNALATRARDSGYQAFKIETPLFNAHHVNLRAMNVFEGKTSLAILAIPEETEVDVSLEHCVRL
jgi:tetratricopeptide (TPR) repeat protein/precorrin-6B methylase 2